MPYRPFTSADGREFQKRSLAKRIENQQAPPDKRLIKKRLEDIELAMRNAPTSQVWDQLSRAYERLFRVWCWLAGLPSPGSRRPAPEPKQRRKGAEELDPTAASPVDLLRETE